MGINTNVIYAPEDFKPHWVEDLDENIYHADKSAVGSSSLRLMLDSPKAFQWGFFKGYEKEQTENMRLGRLIHMAVLEGSKFKERYVVMPQFTGRTLKGEITSSPNCKEVKDKREAWLSDQRPDAVITTEEEVEMITGIIDGLMERIDGPELFQRGRPEVSGFYRDPETGIKLKVRPDFLSLNSNLLVDLKSARTSERRRFGSNSFSDRYDFQMAMYRQGVMAISGVKPSLVAMVSVEKKWPFENGIYWYEESDFIKADGDYRTALTRLAQCMKENKWPQRQQRAERIYTPNWFINESVEMDIENII